MLERMELFGHLIVVGCDHPSFTRGDYLSWMKTKARVIRELAHKIRTYFGAQAASSVFQAHEAELLCLAVDFGIKRHARPGYRDENAHRILIRLLEYRRRHV